MKILSRQWIASILVVVVTLLLSMTALELAMRFLIKPSAVMTRQLLLGMGVTDSDQNWEKDAELGWTIKQGASFRHVSPFGDFDIPIRTDALGLRVPLDPGAERPRAARNLLFIGDSQTASYEVQYEQTFPALVQQALGPSTRALNAGIRGYSAEQTLKRMRALLAKEELGVTDVIYLFSANDPFENMSLHFPKRLMSKPGAYLDSQGGLRYRMLDHPVGVFDAEALFVAPGGEIAALPLIGARRPVRLVKDTTKRILLSDGSWLDRSYLFGLAKVAWDMFATPSIPEAVRERYPYINASYVPNDAGGYMPGSIGVTWEPDSYPIRLLEEVVKQMKAEADRRRVRFWLVVPLFASATEEEFFTRIAPRYRINLIDTLSDGFSQQVQARCGSLMFNTDAHYNACAHMGQSEAIVAALKRTGAE